jgi:radical SAM superfamily enzyme YgiQ (UPF0313 family)
MKVLLVYPYFLEKRVHEEEISVPPQGLYFVGAMLKSAGYSVEVRNWHNAESGSREIRETLREFRPDVIGFSILHANRWGGIEIAGIARKELPQTKNVFGGVGASYLWEHLLTHFSQIDAVVIGEGEKSFLNLVRHYETAQPALESIGGLAFRRNGRPARNDCDPLIREPDELPNPAQYFSYQHLSLTRGCPGECSFCGSPDFWGRRVRFHSATYFVDQLEMLYRRGIDYFFISDDTFTVNKQKAIAVCKEILRRRLPVVWQAISRVDMIDEDILFWMRKAGCIQISYGVESGSEKIRKLLKKNYPENQIEKAFALTTRYGILSRAYFIYGCPGETDNTVEQTIDLMKRIKPLGTIFYILDIFPGTELYRDYLQRHAVTDDIWLERVEDILYFETDPVLTREQVLAFGRKLRSAFYRHLPGFVDAVQLVDIEELAPLHADFLSRLAMTFDHGDYATIDAIEGKSGIARQLYERALQYHPDPRAYLGLGMQLQKNGRMEDCARLLGEATAHFPNHEQLNICLGVSFMNMERYEDALRCFEPFAHDQQTMRFLQICRQALR